VQDRRIGEEKVQGNFEISLSGVIFCGGASGLSRGGLFFGEVDDFVVSHYVNWRSGFYPEFQRSPRRATQSTRDICGFAGM
jgi:hypothetical protein